MREVTDREIAAARKTALKNRREDTANPVNWPYLTGLCLILQGQNENDPTAARTGAKLAFGQMAASKALKPTHFVDGTKESVLAFNSMLQRLIADSPFQLAMMISGQLAGCHPAIYLSGDMTTKKVRGAPINVMFCENFAAAAAYKLFFNGLQVCLHCQKLFIKKRPGQTCCSVEHREAHRLIRWRERKKIEAEQKRRKGQ